MAAAATGTAVTAVATLTKYLDMASAQAAETALASRAAGLAITASATGVTLYHHVGQKHVGLPGHKCHGPAAALARRPARTAASA
jgi:hypothetical protein